MILWFYYHSIIMQKCFIVCLKVFFSECRNLASLGLTRLVAEVTGSLSTALFGHDLLILLLYNTQTLPHQHKTTNCLYKRVQENARINTS